MVNYLKYFASFCNWSANLASYPQRQNLSTNVLRVVSRAVQKRHGAFAGNLSKNIDLHVNFSTDSIKEWLKSYYNLESITLINRRKTIWLENWYGVDDVKSKCFQEANVIGVDDTSHEIIDFNMYGVDENMTFFNFDFEFSIKGILSDKQKEDIRLFIKLRTQKSFDINFNSSDGTVILAQVYLLSTGQRVEVDIRNENGTLFINDVIETDISITSTYRIVKIADMQITQITGDGIQTIFSFANPHNNQNVFYGSKYAATGQFVDTNATITESTITIDTGSVALANGIVIDILTTEG